MIYHLLLTTTTTTPFVHSKQRRPNPERRLQIPPSFGRSERRKRNAAEGVWRSPGRHEGERSAVVPATRRGELLLFVVVLFLVFIMIILIAVTVVVVIHSFVATVLSPCHVKLCTSYKYV